jgi:hypothetical protein
MVRSEAVSLDQPSSVQLNYPGTKGGTAVALRKGIPHNHLDPPPVVSVEVTGFCIPIGSSEVLLASVYKSPGRAWSDADITELLSLTRKSILAGDLNDKCPFWNSEVSNPSGEKLMTLFNLSEFEISAPQCPTHYSPAGYGDVLDIVIHENIRYHCLRYFGLRSHTNIIPHTGSCQNWKSFRTY